MADGWAVARVASLALAVLVMAGLAFVAGMWWARRQQESMRASAEAAAPAVPLELHLVLNFLGRCVVAAPHDTHLHDGVELASDYLAASSPARRDARGVDLRSVVSSYWALQLWMTDSRCLLTWQGDDPGRLSSWSARSAAVAITRALKDLGGARLQQLVIELTLEGSEGDAASIDIVAHLERSSAGGRYPESWRVTAGDCMRRSLTIE